MRSSAAVGPSPCYDVLVWRVYSGQQDVSTSLIHRDTFVSSCQHPSAVVNEHGTNLASAVHSWRPLFQAC